MSWFDEADSEGSVQRPGSITRAPVADIEPDRAEGVPVQQPGGDDEPEPRLEVPAELPILPIRNAVMFPGTIMPLTVSREKAKLLLNSVLMSEDRMIGIFAQRRADVEDPGINDLYWVGTAGTILKLLKMPDGSQSIIVHGVARIGIEKIVQTEPFLRARVTPRYDAAETGREVDALMHSVRHAAERIIEKTPSIPDEAAVVLANIDSPGLLADFLASNISLGVVHKQELLETFDVVERLKKVNATLISQLDVLELQDKLQTQVRDQIDKNQRQYYLQEQLKAIQKELGQEEGRESEIERLRGEIDQAGMPEAVRAEAVRELDRLSRMSQASADYSMTEDYLHWLLELPWAKSTEDSLDINEAQRILDEDHYGLEKVKKRIIEFLAVRKLKPEGRGPILCFLGPPGVGKTSLGQSIARSMGREFIRMSLGGMRDEAELRGHRRTYIGAMPGRIIQELRKAGSNNPVFMLDEVDKLGQDFRGDPASALLEILDPRQNNSFTDHYLGVPFDLSRVLFIATANYADPIPPALRDRMETINITGYAPHDKLQIARRYLVRRQREENGLSEEQIAFSDDALERIITSYTRESGVRTLEREIGSVCRGVAAKIARGDIESERIAAESLSQYLGPEKFEPEMAMRTSVPGVATGLAYTPTGGEILFIEATAMKGNGRVMLTGQLGDVMRESAHAAFSLIRSHLREFDVAQSRIENSDIHIHVPAGAIPKDGPSAGVSMFTAMVSLLTSRSSRADVAMTGEITLRGMVLPVGGIREKVLAAVRAGIHTVILPRRNERDLVELPRDVQQQVEFVLVDRVEQVLEAALETRPSRGRKRARTRQARTAAATARGGKSGASARKAGAGRSGGSKRPVRSGRRRKP